MMRGTVAVPCGPWTRCDGLYDGNREATPSAPIAGCLWTIPSHHGVPLLPAGDLVRVSPVPAGICSCRPLSRVVYTVPSAVTGTIAVGR